MMKRRRRRNDHRFQSIYNSKHPRHFSSLQFLRYEARSRIEAGLALKHDFFAHLPPEVRQLPDTESIFVVKGVRLAKDPGGKSLGAITGGLSGNKRRQSMLF